MQIQAILLTVLGVAANAYEVPEFMLRGGTFLQAACDCANNGDCGSGFYCDCDKNCNAKDGNSGRCVNNGSGSGIMCNSPGGGGNRQFCECEFDSDCGSNEYCGASNCSIDGNLDGKCFSSGSDTCECKYDDDCTGNGNSDWCDNTFDCVQPCNGVDCNSGFCRRASDRSGGGGGGGGSYSIGICKLSSEKDSLEFEEEDTLLGQTCSCNGDNDCASDEYCKNKEGSCSPTN